MHPKGDERLSLVKDTAPQYHRRQTEAEIRESLNQCHYTLAHGAVTGTFKLTADCGWHETWDGQDWQWVHAHDRQCPNCNGWLTRRFPGEVVPHPVTQGEIRKAVEAGDESWGPRELWVTEPIEPEMAPPHEVADMEAERLFHERNNLQSESAGLPTDLSVLIPLAALNKALAEEGESVIQVERAEDLHEPGAKADRGKLDYTLVPIELEEAVCEVMMFGARKYSRDGWRQVPDAPMRYLAALERHVKAFKAGEDYDPESGLHHLKHATCNLAFLLHFLGQGADIGYWRATPEEEFDGEEHYNGA